MASIVFALLVLSACIGFLHANPGVAISCPRGYTGRACQSDIDECASSPCHNEGTCYQIPPRVFGPLYVCLCKLGHTGSQCENLVRLRRQSGCTPNPCLNGGICAAGSPFHQCICPKGYTGYNCEIPTFDCGSFPCLNGGTCYSVNTPPQVGVNFVCQCPGSYTGYRCETGLNPCASNPCATGSCTATSTSFVCTCANGYTGTRCNIDIDECSLGPCRNGGGCTQITPPPQFGALFRCSCPSGYTGSLCEFPPSPCLSNPCLNGGTCVTNPLTGTSFTCACQGSFSGTFCTTVQSGCSPSPCQNGGACNSQANGGFTCSCASGWTGTTCNQQTITSTCSVPATCVNGVCQGNTCVCSSGWTGTNCNQQTVADCRSASSLCQNGGTCVSTFTTSGATLYSCSCVPGFVGTYCQVPTNFCGSNPCFNGGTCVPELSYYRCNCPRGYAGTRCEFDNDECSPNPCAGGQGCFQITPPPQFGPLYQCGTVPMTCTPSPCQNGAGCVLVGQFAQCQCQAGTSGSLCEKKDAATCFPGRSHVLLRDGSSLEMSRLRIGDEVLTQDDSDQLRFAAVLAFLDYKPTASADYLRIATMNNTEMSISPLHLVAVLRDGEKQFIHARQVKAGDELFVHREDAFSLEQVSGIREHVDEGAFAPLTETGTVVVDGVVASCYAVVNSHEVAHWVLTPLRWWSNIKRHFTLMPDESREGMHAFAGWLSTIAPSHLFT